MFITVFTTVPYWPICWKRWIHSSVCHPITLRHISIPSIHSLFLKFVSFLQRPLCVSFTFLAWFLSQQITVVSCVGYGVEQWLVSNPVRPSISWRNGRLSDVSSLHAVCAIKSVYRCPQCPWGRTFQPSRVLSVFPHPENYRQDMLSGDSKLG